MFGNRFFGNRYFGGRYFAHDGVAPPPPGGGENCPSGLVRPHFARDPSLARDTTRKLVR